jgi:hypothetical protein
MAEDPTFQDIVEALPDDAMLADGFEDALVGMVETADGLVALYDRRKCIKILEDRDDMTEEDAEEYFDYNVIRGAVGTGAPMFAEIMR